MCLSQRVKGAGRCPWLTSEEVYPWQIDTTVWDLGDKSRQMVMENDQRGIVAKAMDVEKMVQGRWAK